MQFELELTTEQIGRIAIEYLLVVIGLVFVVGVFFVLDNLITTPSSLVETALLISAAYYFYQKKISSVLLDKVISDE